MNKYYFTFGFGQKFENCFTVIEAKNRSSAREKMFTEYGNKWSMQYDDKGWYDETGESQQERYNLREIK